MWGKVLNKGAAVPVDLGALGPGAWTCSASPTWTLSKPLLGFYGGSNPLSREVPLATGPPCLGDFQKSPMNTNSGVGERGLGGVTRHPLPLMALSLGWGRDQVLYRAAPVALVLGKCQGFGEPGAVDEDQVHVYYEL